jgi:hypothetical protein
MHHSGVEVSPRNAIYLSANLENAHALPPITDESFAQRIIYLRSHELRTPLNDGSPKAKEECFAKLLHGLSGWLASAEIADVKSEPLCDLYEKRWGVKGFHHPDILAALAQADSSSSLAELLDMFLSGAPAEPSAQAAIGYTSVKLDPGGAEDATWEGTASSLYNELERMFGNVRGWVSGVKNLGHSLRRLSTSPAYAARIRAVTGHNNTKRWTISLKPPAKAVAKVVQMPLPNAA